MPPAYPPTPSPPSGYTHVRTPEYSDDIEAGGDTADGDEEELAWAAGRAAKRRRWGWRETAVGLVVGLVVGAGAFHAGSRGTAAETKEEAVQLDYSAYHASLNGSTTAQALVPVRIHYRGEPGLNQREPLLPPACPIPVVYTGDEMAADIVVLNTDSHMGINKEEKEERMAKRPWQSTAVWGVESAANRGMLEAHFDRLKEGKREETAEYEMTYRLNSTVPATYSYNYFDYANPPLPFGEKRSDRIAASLISNCHPRNARTLILEELTSLLPGQVDNFGSCRRNANADETLKEMGLYDAVGQHTQWNTKITLIGHYKFTFAIENSNDYGYVTEKYFQALERGSVPLVFGAPGYKELYFPSPNAGIDLADYLPANYSLPSTTSSQPPAELDAEAKAGLARLAKRLEYLSSDEGQEEYQSMLAWKKEDFKRDDNPLGKILKQSTHKYGQDCRLAGVFRGGDNAWAVNTWTP